MQESLSLLEMDKKFILNHVYSFKNIAIKRWGGMFLVSARIKPFIFPFSLTRYLRGWNWILCIYIHIHKYIHIKCFVHTHMYILWFKFCWCTWLLFSVLSLPDCFVKKKVMVQITSNIVATVNTILVSW